MPKIVKPDQDKVLSRSKICRKLPPAVRHGPKDLAGLGMKNILIVQGTENLDVNLTESQQNSMVGSLIKAS